MSWWTSWDSFQTPHSDGCFEPACQAGGSATEFEIVPASRSHSLRRVPKTSSPASRAGTLRGSTPGPDKRGGTPRVAVAAIRQVHVRRLFASDELDHLVVAYQVHRRTTRLDLLLEGAAAFDLGDRHSNRPPSLHDSRCESSLVLVFIAPTDLGRLYTCLPQLGR